MQIPVLLGLAALWAAVLLPDFLRRRGTRRSADSISAFNRNLSVLGNASPVGHNRPSVAPNGANRSVSNVLPFVPRTVSDTIHPLATEPVGAEPSDPVRPTPARRSPAAQRRQDIIVGLAALSLLTLLAMLTFGGPLLYLHLLVDVALVAYLAAALNVSRVENLRSRVAYLPQQSSSVLSSAPLLSAAPPNRRSAAR